MNIVSITGLGNVGSSVLFSLMQTDRKTCFNIIDPNKLIEGKLLDLNHAFHINDTPHKMYINDFEIYQNSDYIIHTAGAQNKPNTSRLEVLEENRKVTEELFKSHQFKPSCKIIVVSNPVDIISYYTWQYSGVKSSNIIGTGTLLDSKRLEYEISSALTHKTEDISAMVLGEHGDSQVAIFSNCFIGNQKLFNDKLFSCNELNELANRTIKSAHRIRKTQESTHYGVAQCVVKIINDLHSNVKQYYPLSVLTNEYYTKELQINKPIFISVPLEVSSAGIKIVNNYSFTEREIFALRKSANIIEALIQNQTRAEN